MSAKSLQSITLNCNANLDKESLLNCVALELQNYFIEKNINNLVNCQYQKAQIANTAYWYLGCNPPFMLGELYLRLKIDKALLK
jgi:hypothetical protein